MLEEVLRPVVRIQYRGLRRVDPGIRTTRTFREVFLNETLAAAVAYDTRAWSFDDSR